MKILALARESAIDLWWTHETTPPTSRRAIEPVGGVENTQLSDLTCARHLASLDPHRRQKWSLRLGIFLKLK